MTAAEDVQRVQANARLAFEIALAEMKASFESTFTEPSSEHIARFEAARGAASEAFQGVVLNMRRWQR